MALRGNLDIFANEMKKNISRDLNVGTLGSVVSLSQSKDLANIQPMALTSSGIKRAMLIDVRVSRAVRDMIKVGDVSVLLFLDRNSNNFDGTNKEFIIQNERTHSVNDAVVVGLL